MNKRANQRSFESNSHLRTQHTEGKEHLLIISLEIPLCQCYDPLGNFQWNSL